MIVLNFKEYQRADTLEEITNPAIFTSNKHDTFTRDGLYSEQIFGPEKVYKCQCGKVFGKINAGKECMVCNVLCSKTESRNTQFAKINLPAGIYVVNPDFKNALQDIFGHNSIKNILSKHAYNSNKEHPYYFSLKKYKLIKSNKMAEDDNDYIDHPVFDINSLKDLFFLMYDLLAKPPVEDEPLVYKYRHFLTKSIKESYLKFVFLNYILVLPPNSRQVVKISNTKILPHPITKAYIEILKNISKGTSVLDNLYNTNSDFFGNTVYKYQQSVDDVYHEILQFNFQKKDNYVRESLTGKTVEFSQRAVIIPNPVLKPYQLGLPEESIKKIFLPELLRFLFTEYEDKEIEIQEETGEVKHFDVVEYIQYIYDRFDNNFEVKLPEADFKKFLEEKIKDFRVLTERQPNLWKYSSSCYVIARSYGDSENDIFQIPELEEHNIPEEYKYLYYEAMEEAPKYVKDLVQKGSGMGNVFLKNMKMAIHKIYRDKVKNLMEE
jgi:DNA-directed RNA polymerase beta' subunit